MLNFTLRKLSYTTDLTPNAPAHEFKWTHVQQGLVLVIDNFRSGSMPSEKMRVVQANQVLFDINVQELIDEGKSLISTCTQRGQQVLCDQLPIYGIIKFPLLALRYALQGGGKVQRIQLKFSSEQDYEAAVSYLRQLGLWMNPAKTAKSSETNSSTSLQSSGPSCPPSQLSELASRPSTAAAAPGFPLKVPLGDAENTRPQSARSETQNPLIPPVYFQRPNSTTSEVLAMDSCSRISAGTEDWPSLTARPESPISFVRPSSSDLPPRRELPFARPDTPKSRGSDSTRPSSRPSSAMGPPPLPVSRAGNKRPGSRSALDLPPLPKPTIIGAAHTEPMQSSTLSRVPISGNSKVGRPMFASAGKENEPPSSSSPFPRPATSDGTLRSSPLSSISEGDLNQAQARPHDNLATSPTSVANDCGPLISSESNTTSDVDHSGLVEYAQKSDDERMAALNNFILRHLEDDNFLTLVDDMDACWARIVQGR